MGNKDDLDDEPLGLGKADDPQGEEAGLDDATADAGVPEDDLDVVVVEDEPEMLADDADANVPPTDDDTIEDDDGLTKEDRSFSKDVQGRIKREIRVRKRAVEAADARTQQEVIARQAAENRTLNLELVTIKMADKSLESEIKEARAELIAAEEAGETEKKVDAQQKLNDLQIRRREIDGLRANLEDRVEKAKTAPTPGVQSKIRPITAEWMGRNKWFGDAKYSVATAATIAVDAQMAKDGWNPDDPKFYIELDRRLNQELPNLRQRLRAEQPRQQNRPGPGTIVSPSKPAPARAASPNRVTLDKADIQTMRSFGMDPTNKVHLQQFARSKQEQS